MGKAKQQFGGDWTQDKLDRVFKYLRAYMQIMKDKPFKVGYIDAFAGTGYVELKRDDSSDELMFPELVNPESQEFLDGSARQALRVTPPFHSYIFVEKTPTRFTELSHLKIEFPQLADRIKLKNEEANKYLKDLCDKNKSWGGKRAVLFLDPFGMSVEWTTIEAIAATKAIDLWYLFPLGVAVGRLLVKSGQIPRPWRQRLDRIFGAKDWFDVFYRRRKEVGLFEDREETDKIADFDAIGRYFVGRLQTVFPGVATNPLPLCNSKNVPLYLLCFAAGNPQGAKTAVKIAQHILGR